MRSKPRSRRASDVMGDAVASASVSMVAEALPGAPHMGRSRLLLLFVLYVLAVMVIGGLLAWPVWRLLGPGVAFHKLVARLAELLAIAGMWPLLRAGGSAGRDAWGYASGAGVPGELARGAVLGVASLVLIALALLALGARVPVPGAVTAGHIARLAAAGALSGVAVALIEESWFRGAMHTFFRRGLALLPAVFAGSLVFGLLHFARADHPITAGDVHWWSGLWVMSRLFGRLGGPAVADSLPALVSAGVVLALCRELTGRIWLGVGVHAGWVAAIRVTHGLTDTVGGGTRTLLAGHYDGVVGWLACGVFVLMSVLLWHRLSTAHPARERA